MKKKAIAKNAIVAGEYHLAIRQKPFTTTGVIGYCTGGTELDTLEESGEWTHVSGLDRHGEAVDGWVLTKYLE